MSAPRSPGQRGFVERVESGDAEPGTLLLAHDLDPVGRPWRVVFADAAH